MIPWYRDVTPLLPRKQPVAEFVRNLPPLFAASRFRSNASSWSKYPSNPPERSTICSRTRRHSSVTGSIMILVSESFAQESHVVSGSNWNSQKVYRQPSVYLGVVHLAVFLDLRSCCFRERFWLRARSIASSLSQSPFIPPSSLSNKSRDLREFSTS